MKSVITSIQPYWAFLIIAKAMGWDIQWEKTIEVRKSYPKDKEWNGVTHIYCGKNRKSFKRIPKQYQPFMKKLLGKVIGEFVCDSIEMVNAKCSDYGIDLFYHDCFTDGCLTEREIEKYFNVPEGKDLREMKGNGYVWHISDLKIYDEPKELGEFRKPCDWNYDCCTCKRAKYELTKAEAKVFYGCDRELTCPPQSWCYVEE